MSDDFDNFIEDLTSGNADAEQLKATKTTKPGKFAKRQFPCESCRGTGRWSGGYVNRVEGKCHACNGVGYFVTSPEARAKARSAAATKRADAATAAQQANQAHGDGYLLRWLGEVESWNTFAASLMEQHRAGKAWSEKQVDACRRMHAKMEAKKADKAAAAVKREAEAPAVELQSIVDMFAAAKASGYKKPMYRANGLRIKPGRVEGDLYVLTEERMEFGTYGEQPGYEGKITLGKFFAARNCNETTMPKLLAIAADPKGEAIRHGQRTGTCSCCGRELTKHASIEAGIGPICAAKWGF